MYSGMLQGRQIGTYLTDGKNGIQVTYAPNEPIVYQRIIDGNLDEYKGLAMETEVYDERQGSYVAGIVLCDASGHPISDAEYKLSDFEWSGNISYGGGEVVNWEFL